MAGGNEYAVLDTTGTGHAATGASVIVAGWGTMSEGGESPDVMHDVTISMLDFADCNTAYEGGLLQGMVCAGVWEGGKDSCQGDSGGPLFVKQSGTWYVVGVVSWGNGCAQANFPGVYYTSVAYYNSWILATMVGRETVPSLPPSPSPLLRAPPSAPPSPSSPPSAPPGVGCVAGNSTSRCPNSCAASCSSCACQTCAVCATVTVVVVASGSVNDYEDTTDLQNRFAIAADVPPGAVVVSVSAASVRIVATISPVSGTTASSVETRMRTYVGTAADASATLGFAVATDPTITRESSGLALGVLIGIIIGAVFACIFVVGLLVMFICCCMGRAGLRGGGSKNGIQPET